VTVKEVSGAGTIKDGRLQAPVGDAWTEVFFALQGPADERVRVEIHHADNIEAKTEYCGNGGFRDGRGLVTKNLDALEAAEVTARTKAKGAAAARDTVLAIVHSDLDGLRHYVQTLFTTPAVYLALDRRTRRPGWRG
jgi:hypothetical protein